MSGNLTIQTLSEAYNEILAQSYYQTNKILTNPDSVSELLNFVKSAIAGAQSYMDDKKILSNVVADINCYFKFLGFYKTVQGLNYVFYPFTNQSLDLLALEKSLNNQIYLHLPVMISKEPNFAKILIDKMREKGQHYSQNAIKNTLKNCIANYCKNERIHLSEDSLDKFINNLVVQKQPRPTLEIIQKSCFTIAGISRNLIALQKWEVIDLASISHKIGNQCQLSHVIVQAGLPVVAFSFTFVGSTISLGVESKKLYHNFHQWKKSDQATQNKAKQILIANSITMLIKSLDYCVMTAPLVCAPASGTLLILSGVSSGLGMYKLFAFSK